MRAIGRMTAIFVALIVLFPGVGAPSAAFAQTKFPTRTLRIVTPFAAGAASDIELRFLADRLSRNLQVPVVVENQPGAGGFVAARSVISAPPDGYTMAWVGNNTAISVSLFKHPVDPRTEMAPIVGVSEFAYLLVTNVNSPYKTLADFIAAAKAKPNTLLVGTSSAGTSNHLTALLFKSVLNLDVIVLPYRGPSELSIALLRNDVDLVINAYGGLRQGLTDNQIRALATTNSVRLEELPDVPTMAEAGVPDFEVTSWNALYAHANAPRDTVDIIRQAVTKILSQDDVKAKFREIGFVANALSTEPLDRRMRTEIDRWAKVITEAGIERN